MNSSARRGKRRRSLRWEFRQLGAAGGRVRGGRKVSDAEDAALVRAVVEDLRRRGELPPEPRE